MYFPTHAHPDYTARFNNWKLWRDVYEGGEQFLDTYLKKHSNREDENDFLLRKAISPIPAFAKAAIKDIRNSIFQHLSSVSRNGGSLNYQAACKGEKQGVDNRGSSMVGFLGKHVLDELLVMSGVGVYVDAPASVSMTKNGETEFKPYLYTYKIENVKNWERSNPEHPSEFQSVLLEECEETYDDVGRLPKGSRRRLRHVWINKETGFVNVQFHYPDDKTMLDSDVIELKLRKIPFVWFDLQESLIKDVAHHQIALLNIWSSNVNYACLANFPFYIEQADPHTVGRHLKQNANASGTGASGGQEASDLEMRVGAMKGRRYAMEANAPQFIHPSAEPLDVSLRLCEILKVDIRELINLAVINMGVQASAESKKMDNTGLEAGLSFIGLVLEEGERQIAQHWAAYEGSDKPAIVAYPERWSLQTTAEIIDDATHLHEVVSKMPSRQAKKETTKILIEALLGKKLPAELMARIKKEIDDANFTTSDPEVVKMAKEQGLLSAATGAEALGFDRDEAAQAEAEHIKRLEEIAKHQTTGIQGITDTQADPKAENKAIQEKNPDTETEPKRERGKGQL